MLVSVFGGVVIYSVLSHVLVPHQITIPVAIIMSILIFGLTRYYSHSKLPYESNNSDQKPNSDYNSDVREGRQNQISSTLSLSKLILFAVIFATALFIDTLSKPDLSVFTNWSYFGPMDIIQLGASIMLTFFLPGYAILLILTKFCSINRIMDVVIAYLFSTLVTGLTTYISGASFGASFIQIKILLSAVYIAILIIIVTYYFFINRRKLRASNSRIFYTKTALKFVTELPTKLILF